MKPAKPTQQLAAPLTVLITRPTQPATELAGMLKTHGINSICQPMFHYQAALSLEACQLKLSKLQLNQDQLRNQGQPILIFVSVAAVNFAQQSLPIAQWPHSAIIAVGSATQQALQKLGLTAHCPARHDSEGILQLPLLADVAEKNVLIIRGDGGREHLAEQLNLRGATVSYLEVYQRVWRPPSSAQINQWRHQGINCIVVTSNALLESVVHLLIAKDKYWQNNCLWVVASERIAENAKQLGLQLVMNAGSATNKAMLTAITNDGIRS